MHILFIVNALPQQLAENEVVLASCRYRALIPARELAKLGIRAEVRSFIDAFRPDFASDADLVVLQQPKPDICAFAPVIAQYWNNLDSLQRRGRPLLLDVSDYKFGAEHDRVLGAQIGAERVAFYRAALEELYRRCSGAVAPTEALGALLRPHLAADRPVCSIPDPVEVARGEPRFAPSPSGPLRLLWFGYFGNHAAIMQHWLREDLDRIAARAPLDLRLLCEPLTPEQLAAAAGAAYRRHAIRADLWSVPALESALDSCDIVVLPFATGSAQAAGKSNNRALQALHAGRYVVAHPIDSYRPLAAFCGIDAALPAAIAAALADPAGTLERIRRGQAHVAAQYGPAAIGQRWAALAQDALASGRD